MRVVVSTGLFIVAVMSACSSSDAPPTVAATPDGGAVEASAPAGCNDAAEAKDSLPCADDAFALFVDVNAQPGGNGTKAKPLGKINDALAQVRSTGKQRIYVCGTSTYNEHVVINGENAARLIGGFECNNWTPVPNTKAKVAPVDAGYALKIDSVPGDLRVEDMAFEAIAGDASSASTLSSIAVFAATSPNVTFTRVNLVAHAGAKGADGAAGATGVATFSTGSDGVGSTPNGAMGGVAKTCTCSSGGSSVGGRGGDINGGNADGQMGLPQITPNIPAGANGSPSTNAECSSVTPVPGTQGSAAPPASDSKSPPLGKLTATGWTPGDGAQGAAGGPGQGGGGAGGQSAQPGDNAGGSGGGCGGCGGTGCGGGKAGGISVALMTFDSAVVLQASTLKSDTGGPGGAGQVGGTGAAGSNGGQTILGGCHGGHGGAGGNGGAGAGGSGGISAAVLYSGSPPIKNDSTLTPGTGGAKGIGGAPTQNDGVDGTQGDLLQAP